VKLLGRWRQASATVIDQLVSRYLSSEHTGGTRCGISSDWFQVAFIHDALVRLTAALDPVLRFPAIVGKLPENRVVAPGR
jgi:hypothetical protein